MGKPNLYLSIFILVTLLPFSLGQSNSEKRVLLRTQRILEYPSVLNGWNNWTYFCGIPPGSDLALVCSNNRIIELSIIGDKGSPSLALKNSQNFRVSDQTLSSDFSLDSLFTTVTKLSYLKVLRLVSLGLWGPLPPAKIGRFWSLQVFNISSNFIYGRIPQQLILLTNLEMLILDDNMFNGSLINCFTEMQGLSFLSVSNNSLDGPIPASLGNSKNLSVLILSGNNLSGPVPNLRGLFNLRVLDLGDNNLGPDFPAIGNKLVSLVLRKNMFWSSIGLELGSYNLLQMLDLSYNNFVGPILLSLFSLPEIQYLNLAGNKLSGVLPMNLPCNQELEFVDLSNNLLSGELPRLLDPNSGLRTVQYSGNCLASNSTYQHPNSFCQQVALAAVNMTPQIQKNTAKKASKSKMGLIFGIAGGLLGGLVVVGILMWVLLQRKVEDKEEKTKLQKCDDGNDSFWRSPRPLPSARYMAQPMTLGALGLPPYHVFTVEELQEATNNFDELNLMSEGSKGLSYKGHLSDGTSVVVRCLQLKQKHTSQGLNKHMEHISKLRHRHLVSILGHCVVSSQDQPNVKEIFLVFERVSNGTLRSHITDRRTREVLKWQRRVATAIGVARGIQFLHSGISPGIFGHDLKMENILLDQNLTAKISRYNLPILSKSGMAKASPGSPFSGRDEPDELDSVEDGDKVDVYQFGIILLELITGKPITCQSDLDMIRVQIQERLKTDLTDLRGLTDLSIRYTFADGSLKTVMEVAVNCISEDPSQRPSIEDVLWNLHYSVQVQEGWSGKLSLNEHN